MGLKIIQLVMFICYFLFWSIVHESPFMPTVAAVVCLPLKSVTAPAKKVFTATAVLKFAPAVAFN